MRRDLATFRRAAAPMREVVNAIIRKEIDFVDEQAIVHFHDVVRPRAAGRRPRRVATRPAHRPARGRPRRDLEPLNQVMKKMTSWGAILIVATLIAGIYGMNFRHMPELRWQYGYLDRARPAWACRRSCSTACSSAATGSNGPRFLVGVVVVDDLAEAPSVADHPAEPPTDLEQRDRRLPRQWPLDEHLGRRELAARRSRGGPGRSRGSATDADHRPRRAASSTS